ncbi:phenolic acid decarboxylase [Agrobacterium tumefaciens]|uniref:Flavin prenyltransferase UbiX n=1 Tax=Agrobacterium fabrum (strain C58 / ATCC 33970) TaxID=176299 RepID=A9CGK1_AGRFC|nr:UbiX family flavin prenyltransferase [Agrobacterium fabrum]KEY53081.1 phenolic acid decarboxylase [Agrobacterium tumefaciens]AAK89046.1 3-polyprenyl-4-hydroxybenzoate decarboxylase [Agrobacterium fabrum str. C58]KJX85861.1 phenylacrylic acid decarboxylase [Agrobacterium tumefaciens]MCX2876818.1 UbiX family flavin prenyltransferase [Agrobacterium fabrum]NMV70069.1 UbiX family flavin prenyltransferase [Agrobacterium fabrum]
MTPCRVVVGVTGASGAGIALRIIERLAAMKSVEIHLVLSPSARRTVLHEEGAEGMGRMLSLASVNHAVDDIGAAIASGSFPTTGMIVAPCSMRTLAAIATGLSDNLITRAADVHLKERRKLVLMTRETPLHLIHLRNMCAVTEAGAIVMPPVPAFYNRPQSVFDIVDQLAARAIDQLGISSAPQAPIWQPHVVKTS